MQKLLYIESKADNSAYIVLEHRSKSGRTVYFNNKALKQNKGSGIEGNFYDLETGEEYWVSGPKKNMQDHLYDLAAKYIQEEAVELYLKYIGFTSLPKGYSLIKLQGTDISRFAEMENSKVD